MRVPFPIKDIHNDISLTRFVIPGLTKPALACPVLDTGYLVRGNPVFLKYWFPAFAGTASGFLLEFTPLKNGAGMTTFAIVNVAVFKMFFYDRLGSQLGLRSRR